MGFGTRRSRVVLASIVAAGALVLQSHSTVRGQASDQRRAAPMSRPASSQPIPPPGTRPADKLTMNFKDAPLDSVLDYFSKAAGFEIIKEGPVDKRVNLVSKQPVSLPEALAMLNASLKANGLAAVQQGRELKIVAWDKAKKSAIPVHFGADPDEIPLTDELITQVIPIKNVDAVKLRDDLKPLIGQETDVAANEGSNTMVLTDTAANIRRLVQIVSRLDQQEATVTDMKVIQLHYASAKDAVKLIDTVFKTDEGGPGGGGRGGPQMQPQQPGQPPPGGGSSRRVRGKVISAADERTNTVVVTGPADTLKSVEELLKKLDANPMPASEIQAFPLRYADAESTSKLITSIFKPQNTNDTGYFRFFYFGSGDEQQSNKVKINAAFDERTNTVIVTAPADVMESVDKLIKKLDANPVAASAIRVFPLRYADAYSAAKLINNIFNPPPTASGNVTERVYVYEGSGPQPAHAAKVNASDDSRTNAVIVTAPAELMTVIAGIISQVDAKPGSEDTLFIYHLRNAQAQNLELVLNTLFGNIQNGQNNQNQQQQQQQQQQNQGAFGNGIIGNSSGGRGLGNNNQLGNRNRNNRRNPNRPQLQPGMAQAINELTGMVLVVAEPDSNSLVITTAAKYEQEVRQIIAELDRPVPQVLIKVLVAEVTHDNSADFGADFSILNTRPNSHGQSFGQTFGVPNSGLVVNFLESNLNATLHLLAQQNKLDVLSRPYILASDNQPASIMVGQDVPIVTYNTITSFGQSISNYVYQPVGIILDVTPHINPEGLVILDVAPEISQLTSQTVNVGPGVNVPVIADRSATSRVGIKDGQTIVIGGLMQDQKTLTVSKVPILGDIPIVKYAFSRTIAQKTKTELLIFLTPHVALQPDVLNPMSQDEMKGTRLTPTAVEPGTFDEHMKGLKRGDGPATQFDHDRSPVFAPEPTSQPSILIPLPTTRPGEEQTVRGAGGP